MAPTETNSSTRQRIIAYLRENPVVTIANLSRIWGLTRADIRYHMNELIEEGLVEVIPRDPKLAVSRGRPVNHYRLAVNQKPGNYASLCAALLDQFIPPLAEDTRSEDTRSEDLHLETERHKALKELASRLTTGYQPVPSRTQRYTKAVAFLNQYAYHARWEATALGPRVMLRTCPYAAILSRYPVLCQLDQSLLENLLQTNLRHAVKMDPETGRPPACIFTSR